jgi:hypothetical protein
MKNMKHLTLLVAAALITIGTYAPLWRKNAGRPVACGSCATL